MDANFIGLYLVRNGIITEGQLSEAIERQRRSNRRIGDMAVARGMLSEAEVHSISTAQRKKDRPFGEIALELGLLDADQLDYLLFSQSIHNSHLGEILLDMGALSDDQIGPLIEAYHAGEACRCAEVEARFGGGHGAEAVRAVVSAFERAFLRFMGEEVKACIGPACDTKDDGGLPCRLGIRLHDGLALELGLRLPEDVAARVLGHRAPPEPGGPSGDFFATVAHYAGETVQARGLRVDSLEIVAGEHPAVDDRGEEVAFCLMTPSGVLMHVRGRMHDAS
ncbi:hypothetical protein dsx2_0503 [Desulfovibrio sp. X2]|uniref:hypothetical protein n=1 Tax=Desulfovibrio sp. X2 TaxID=941449 RepID=UPI000358DD1F|nr:hypothetical protein [Desulfovibrio sp. X2]EPR38694.1 hypothetical protein dsx2_0503 [Desulfovibrio sp. X2]